MFHARLFVENSVYRSEMWQTGPNDRPLIVQVGQGKGLLNCYASFVPMMPSIYWKLLNWSRINVMLLTLTLVVLRI